jgi:hypothetical protein
VRRRREGWLALLAATAATCGAFAAVLLSLHRLTAVSSVAARRREPSREQIVLVVPRVYHSTRRDPMVDRAAPSATLRAPRAPHSPRETPRDTGSAPPDPRAVASETRATASARVPTFDGAARLARPRPNHTGRWVVPTVVYDPFAEPAPPASAVRDSVLAALSTTTPEAAAHRIPARAEVDSAAKEATLKMRLAGRPLLVPPDNSAGLITTRVPLPGGPSKADRARLRRADDEGQARLRRLLARADSARSAREDSLRAATLVAP